MEGGEFTLLNAMNLNPLQETNYLTRDIRASYLGKAQQPDKCSEG